MTRVYVPTTLPLLRRAADGSANGGHDLLPGADGVTDVVCAHAVTARIREWYTEGDDEEFEYAAMVEAAQASLRLLADDPQAPRRRIVVAADVDDRLVVPDASHRYRSGVRIAGGVALRAVVSVHLDEDDAMATVDAACRALADADAGDDDAAFTVEEAEGFDLLWYDVTELPLVLALG